MAKLHRGNSLHNAHMKQTLEDVNIIEEEFIEIVNKGGNYLEELIRRI